MNTYAKVQSLITAWKSQSLSRTDLIRAIAEACLGWPYCPQRLQRYSSSAGWSTGYSQAYASF